MLCLWIVLWFLHGYNAGISIDCGLPDRFGGYMDTDTNNNYVSDGSYVDGGENHNVSAASDKTGRVPPLESVRSFPSTSRLWNCYTLPTDNGTTYLVRAQFLYGNYDGENSPSVVFELHLGTQFWATVSLTPPTNTTTIVEAVFLAWASLVPVCLVNTAGGTPFVSVLELRKLGNQVYPTASKNNSLSTRYRRMMGRDVSEFIRHRIDTFDRFWYGMNDPAQWQKTSTHQMIAPDTTFNVPLEILQTAVEPAGNGTSLTVIFRQQEEFRSRLAADQKFVAFLHLADFQDSQRREFDIYINDIPVILKPYRPQYLQASCVVSSEYSPRLDGTHITLVRTVASVLPPMLNALEIYAVVDMDDTPATRPPDFDAIMRIKREYEVKKNWTGDPCYPTPWDGLKCINASHDDIFKLLMITSLDLPNSNLRGEISQNFSLLAALKHLDLSNNNLMGFIPDSLPFHSLKVLNLSGNNLSGPLPEAICENQSGEFVFSYDQPIGPLCAKRRNDASKRTIMIAVSVVVVVLVVGVLILIYVIRRKEQCPNARATQFENVSGSGEDHGDHLQNRENRRFTYKELEKTTDNFRGFIGHGGFGHVYYGLLENGTEVAVKMRSESSLHGLDQFLAEVQSLTKVHHRNLVSLVGYCWEEDHMALVYEYLSQGSLFDHLRGKNGDTDTLSWETRVRIVLEAAQGLDYLHKGCNLPVIHRDVKTSNILLGRNLEAKLADFGLSKTYLSDSQTHISATAAGSAGYIDPEYYHTGRLTKSSDVYSFGVVLLEIATGKLPVEPGHGHIVHRVNQMITAGDDISSIADVRLQGAYDVTSMWKVIDTANKCTSDDSAQRPTMATVVALLKESLALERAHERYSSLGETLGVDMSPLVSTNGPSAR
ncbi:hypothetical protein U9M48_000707 [Paspalum notatum var. saurae]|uniref:non-specific serine/threonine protein kinase n=1 Tax=Paspalum notatum var. saurae TaxID=547442 RepID=A0AAQ3PMY0_PASNO